MQNCPLESNIYSNHQCINMFYFAADTGEDFNYFRLLGEFSSCENKKSVILSSSVKIHHLFVNFM